MVTLFVSIIIAYLCGSLSSAIIICRLCCLPDPRTQGSGNPGTTNALRIGGKKIAVWVLIGDLLKGLLPVLLAKYLGVVPPILGWVAFAAVLGHAFPLFFRFQGGKGVATAAGVLLALYWPLGVLVIATWILTAILFRYSSLAALVATIAAPVYCLWLNHSSLFWPLLTLCLFVLWRHQENIKRLWQGTETKIGQT